MISSLSSASNSQTSLLHFIRQKDYSSVLASLQSVFGAGGESPMPTHNHSSSASVKSSKSQEKEQPNASVGDSMPSNPSQERNWEDAFATLQSQYGFSGQAPCQPVMPSKPASASSKSTKNSKKSPPSPSFKQKSEGAPQDTFGTGWNPIGPTRNSL